MAAKEKHSRRKKNHILGSSDDTRCPRAIASKCETKCLRQTSVPVQNFSRIRSAVSEEMRLKQTNTKLNIPLLPCGRKKRKKID